MENKEHLVTVEQVVQSIFFIRGCKVMLDTDLAQLYGVTTKRLNEQVKRNRDRFPDDFMFQLTPKEKNEVVANCDHLFKLKYSTALPYAFTEHGAVMLASILNSEKAIRVSIQVVRAFVKLREMLAGNKDLARKLEALERKYDVQFRVVFDAIRKLMAPPKPPPSRRIGFHAHRA